MWNLATQHGHVDVSFTPSAFPGGYGDLVAGATAMPAAGTDVTVLVASLDDVHTSKRAAGRPKDEAYFRRDNTSPGD
jgi:hypothetical protein